MSVNVTEIPAGLVEEKLDIVEAGAEQHMVCKLSERERANQRIRDAVLRESHRRRKSKRALL